jgi:tRNA threonylcarbamoyladenosine dehydratase
MQIIELIQEQLTRTSSFLTPDGLSKVRSTFVVVVGLGGVGSHCTAALARSGVSRLRLIDFDQVTLSSLNRHAVATLADVGTPKVHCMRKRLQAIVPWVQWECFNEIWSEGQATRLLGPFGGQGGQKPDYVVDAIDNIDSKVALLKYCYEMGIKVISSMGAGCKSDPTRIVVGDISATLEDPLSRATRIKLKLQGIRSGIPVVYSIEKPGPGKASLLPLPEEEFQKGGVGELGVLPDFRARILPVLGTMPAVFGLVVANYLIMEVSGYPHEIGGGKVRDKLYDTILGYLQSSEERLARADGQDTVRFKIPISKEDVGFLVDEVFWGKSVISGLTTRLTLVRWKPAPDYKAETRFSGQKSARLSLNDLVCMTKEEALAHEENVLLPRKAPEEVYDKAVVDLVRRRLLQEARFETYR